MDDALAVIEEALERHGIPGRLEKKEKLGRYMEALKERRAWAGLTSRAVAESPASAVAESLDVVEVIDPRLETTVVDVGSGGGLLGVTLAVACPSWRVSLVESIVRKCAFLAETAGALSIENAEVICDRAERLAGRREFDAAVSRAVGSLAVLAPLAIALLREGGLYVAVKGGDPAAEIEDASEVLAGGNAVVQEVVPPHRGGEGQGGRGPSLVVIRKL